MGEWLLRGARSSKKHEVLASLTDFERLPFFESADGSAVEK